MQYKRAKTIADDKDISVSTFWRWVRLGKLPAGKKISNRITVFNSDAMDAAFEKLGVS